MEDKDLYAQLGALTKQKDAWQTHIAYVGTLLEHHSTKIAAKALWLIGEMGLCYPADVAPFVCRIASFLDATDDLLRERALNALGRIGRAQFALVEPYWKKMFSLAADHNPQVRLSLIWASENIATNTPEIYQPYMPLFAELLHDKEDKVRMEAPEIFRVLGKRAPHLVAPYIEQLQTMAANDEHPVVRIHSAGAIRAFNQSLNK
ncbi:MAG: sister chromatid cohesion protein PDS5 [Paludibacteraceae bacterium]|nr:sister chromatid cohesion protein PDS5 [Paludibacteraceae bacterium]